MSGQGNANGNQEYLSTTVNIYRLLEVDGSGPLKSIFSPSKGAVAMISFPESPLKNLGFSSAQTRQDVVILWISSTV
ncbi:hypothetical protein T11_14511 [Trichinella zimbabwensis]|uniref:Uncharacterized protein n=1 Tax=Trichinella zimbabwensis TaxID=268475 RepID=A0A0V1H9B6_9BILA|nr:hypothetical protein T11_14511 [Trichinella zimbabwensis]